MNAAYFHIALVHLPVVFMPLGLLLLVLGHLKHSLTLARTALAILIFASIVTVPVFLLGEPTEEIVEHIVGISEDFIEAHEEAAEVGLWLAVATGIASLAAWWAIAVGSALERFLLILTTCFSFVASIALAYTAHQGGKIRHPEAFSASSAGASAVADAPH
jgi:uncharacterized membrane protein